MNKSIDIVEFLNNNNNKPLFNNALAKKIKILMLRYIIKNTFIRDTLNKIG